jgi:hypothetical protein
MPQVETLERLAENSCSWLWVWNIILPIQEKRGCQQGLFKTQADCRKFFF